MTLHHLRLATIYVLALLYVVVGIKHFTDTDFFLAIMPPYLPLHRELVLLSGVFEIVFGVGLVFKATRRYAAWGIFLLLLAVFPANIHLAMSETAQEALGASQADALIRLPFQIPLLLFAYWHSQESTARWLSILCLVLFVPTVVYFVTLA